MGQPVMYPTGVISSGWISTRKSGMSKPGVVPRWFFPARITMAMPGLFFAARSPAT